MNNVFDIAKAADILQVARGAGLKLKKTGGGYFVPCPLHSDKTPSMIINTSGKHVNRFHCFSCGAGGSVIDFYSILYNVNIKEAAEILADRIPAGTLPVKPVPLPEPEKIDKHSDIFGRFVAWCKSNEATEQKRQVFTYLRGRGLTPEMIKRAKLGAVPGTNQAREFLLQSNNLEEARAAGLLIDTREESNLFALANHPLLIPSVDTKGKIISIQGRAINKAIQPKYRYLKGVKKYPYGLQSLDDTKRVILCEGVFDAIAFHSIGKAAAIALGGLSIPSVLPPIIRGKYVTICLDNDKEPEKAEQRQKDFLRLKEQLHGAGIKHVFRGELINQSASDPGELLAQSNEAKLELMIQKNKSLKGLIDTFKLKIEK
jgi:DNA primase